MYRWHGSDYGRFQVPEGHKKHFYFYPNHAVSRRLECSEDFFFFSVTSLSSSILIYVSSLIRVCKFVRLVEPRKQWLLQLAFIHEPDHIHFWFVGEDFRLMYSLSTQVNKKWSLWVCDFAKLYRVYTPIKSYQVACKGQSQCFNAQKCNKDWNWVRSNSRGVTYLTLDCCLLFVYFSSLDLQ